MRRIVELLWDNGNPIEVTISDIGKKLGNTAYANHRKLSLPPWQLLEDSERPKFRRLTARGERFARGDISIPKKLIRDPISWEWVQGPGTDRITISEV
jgi:hypothetical protein